MVAAAGAVLGSLERKSKHQEGMDTLHVLPHYKETSALALPQLGIDWGHWDKPVISACRKMR